MKKQYSNNAAFTLVEIIIVVVILVFLMYALYPQLSGVIGKNQDAWRIKTLQDYATYYESAKQSIGSYPSAGITNVGGSVEKQAAQAVNSETVGAGYYSEFIFSGDRTDGLYATSPLKEFQEFAQKNGIVGAYSDVKTLSEGEGIGVFTSQTAKRFVMCTKLYAANETAAADGDGIDDSRDPDGGDGHQNGNRIYVLWDMKLWNQLGDPAREKCQGLPNPQEL